MYGIHSSIPPPQFSSHCALPIQDYIFIDLPLEPFSRHNFVINSFLRLKVQSLVVFFFFSFTSVPPKSQSFTEPIPCRVPTAGQGDYEFRTPVE